MTVSPWGERPAKPRLRLVSRISKETLIFGCGSTLLLGVAVGYQFLSLNAPVSSDTYRELARVAQLCPPARPLVRAAMADGSATNAEVTRVAKAMGQAAETFRQVDARVQAAAASGAPAIRPAPACRTEFEGSPLLERY